MWIAVLFVLTPVFSFGVILSLFKNVWANVQFVFLYFKDLFVFSELNEKSLSLAQDIKRGNGKAALVFCDVFEQNEESSYEMMEEARKIGAICFKKDILVINFRRHSAGRNTTFFTVGKNETENLNQSLRLIEKYRKRKNTRLFVLSGKVDSEMLLTAVDKGFIKVRRINEAQSLVYRILYEQGAELFASAKEKNGQKLISAVIIGMGSYGTEMLKALAWYCQMDGYRFEVNVFDKDPLAREKFEARAPELMDDAFNGKYVDGEAEYLIKIHSGIEFGTAAFKKEISKIEDASYAFIALGDDNKNVSAAAYLRMLFERRNIHPVIKAVVYNSEQRNALCGICNYSGQEHDIDFIGDIKSSYTENVIMNSALEKEALALHLKWGAEEEFWLYEYNYRSSLASVIHKRARKEQGIIGACKKEAELTATEREQLEKLEHRRWNAYMRGEGYKYSGSNDKSSRNNLARLHHDLTNYYSLTNEEKIKDGKIAAE